jgi:hypothetical protein
MSDRTDYICPKCRTTYSKLGNGYCACGKGKLEKKFTMADVETIFPWLRKEQE